MAKLMAFHEAYRIIVPTARQSVSQGQNGNAGQFFFPRDSFTFRDWREVGQVV